MNQTTLNELIAESHIRQLNGEDYQRVAVEIAQRTSAKEDEYEKLESSPDADCPCKTCRKFDWAANEREEKYGHG